MAQQGSKVVQNPRPSTAPQSYPGFNFGGSGLSDFSIDFPSERPMDILYEPGLTSELLKDALSSGHQYVHISVDGGARDWRLPRSVVEMAIPETVTDQIQENAGVLTLRINGSPDAFELLVQWLYRGLPANGDHSKHPKTWIEFITLLERYHKRDLSMAATRNTTRLLADTIFPGNGLTVDTTEIVEYYARARNYPYRYIMVHLLVVCAEKFCLPNDFLDRGGFEKLGEEMVRWGAILRRLPQFDTGGFNLGSEIDHAVKIANKYLIPILYLPTTGDEVWPEKLTKIFADQQQEEARIPEHVFHYLQMDRERV